MSLPLLFVSAVAFLLGADDAARDAQKLQGSWKVISFDFEGPKPDRDKMNVTFKDDSLSLQFGDREEKGTIKLNATTKPKSFDYTAPASSKLTLFIYELDGDNLKLCWRKNDGKRPTEFTAKDTDGFLVLKRAK